MGNLKMHNNEKYMLLMCACETLILFHQKDTRIALEVASFREKSLSGTATRIKTPQDRSSAKNRESEPAAI